MGKAKTAQKQEREVRIKPDLTPKVCDGCGRVKSLSKTKAFFAVIEEDRLLCYGCA